MWVQITLPHRELTFWGQFTYLGKVMFSSYICCKNNIDIDIDFIHTLYTDPSEALPFCNCRLLWVTAMSCWTPTTKPTNCLMENTAPRAWARPDPTPETLSPCWCSNQNRKYFIDPFINECTAQQCCYFPLRGPHK